MSKKSKKRNKKASKAKKGVSNDVTFSEFRKKMGRQSLGLTEKYCEEIRSAGRITGNDLNIIITGGELNFI